MKLNKYHDNFLKNVHNYNYKYNHIKIKNKNEYLVFSFWNYNEIVNSNTLKEDWDINSNFIPFYGDWHYLLCLDIESNSIIYFNDSREIIEKWENIDIFKNSLLYKDERKTNSKTRNVKMKLSSDLLNKLKNR